VKNDPSDFNFLLLFLAKKQFDFFFLTFSLPQDGKKDLNPELGSSECELRIKLCVPRPEK